MKALIRKCPNCFRYSLKNQCTKCFIDTENVHPAKYSPDDKYLRYRLADKFN